MGVAVMAGEEEGAVCGSVNVSFLFLCWVVAELLLLHDCGRYSVCRKHQNHINEKIVQVWQHWHVISQETNEPESCDLLWSEGQRLYFNIHIPLCYSWSLTGTIKQKNGNVDSNPWGGRVRDAADRPGGKDDSRTWRHGYPPPLLVGCRASSHPSLMPLLPIGYHSRAFCQCRWRSLCCGIQREACCDASVWTRVSLTRGHFPHVTSGRLT